MRIGFIGFGEVGYEMSKGFLTEDPQAQFFVYDPLYEKEETQQRAKKTHATLFSDPQSVAKETLDVLFVAVPASFAEDAWRSIWSELNEETLYVDLTTASAQVKQRLGEDMLNEKRTFIDGAILGALKVYQHKVPIMVSGTGSTSLIDWGKSAHMNLTYAGDLPGDATNIKFIRSIFTKGLSALLHEVMQAADKLALDDIILDSITRTMDKEPFEQIINRLISSNVIHSQRREKEMENVIDFLNSHGIEPQMTKATRDKLKTITQANILEKNQGDPPKDWKQVMRLINCT
ncbi:NAD(P)-dependent oxidoreductase [Rossellomorea marisflavi]|uniref:NAD(P)-dependent oxidoreductase n=1 Tax=Rossellomorea marisflavi TaxID=189381 RepID=UPI00345991ED